MFKNMSATKIKFINFFTIILLLVGLLIFIVKHIDGINQSNKNILSYSIKVQNSIESLDKIFERAEVNLNVFVDAIYDSYNIDRQQDKDYNLHYINSIDSLVKSVLSNSPNVDGAWFQLNSELPFAVHAYNWYEFKDDQFINVRNQFIGTPSMDRKITPNDDPYYFNAIMNQKPTWSDIYTDADTRRDMITISAPIYKSGKLVGVVGLDISIEKLKQTLADMQTILGKSEIFLLDKNNKVILIQLDSVAEKSKINYDFLNLFKNNSTYLVGYYDNFVHRTAIILTLSNNYKIIISIDDKTLYGDYNQLFIVIYLLYSLLIILFLLFYIKNYGLLKLIRTNNKDIPNQKPIEDSETKNE